MFIDEVQIEVHAGNGGDGCTAFRREKYIEMGGPFGGNGGNGGDVVFEVDEGLNTLIDLRYSKKYRAKNGEHGQGKGMHGKNAPDLIIKVPPGTVVTDTETGFILGDLTKKGDTLIVAAGGRGGRGNMAFATRTNTAPDFCENGEPGEEKILKVELKLLADVGLVGMPSVGKSTIISKISAAKPKIAAYHFTTLSPNLGVVKTTDNRSFVVADLPGLIEGASEGVGLGHQFLRHIERTRVIVHVIDMSGIEGRDPYEDYVTINNELKEYNLRLTERPQIVAANKMDMPDSEENLKTFREQVGEDVQIFPISSFTREGVRELLFAVADLLEETPEFPLDHELEEQAGIHRVMYKFEDDTKEFEISREPDGRFVVSGDKIERLFVMTDFNRDASIARFARQLRSYGVDDALRERGAKDGDIVKICEFEFEFVE